MLDRFPGVRRWDDTDDVFQNAALRLHRALTEIRPQAPRDVMLLAAAQVRRELLDLARRYAGPHSHAAWHATNLGAKGRDPDAPAFHTERAAAPTEGLERWSAFHEAIADLPAEHRELFHLVWYLGIDQRTIAGLLDCSPRTVKARWREAREAVRAALDGRPG
jgi:RNA polymerase sigma-70 factor (ECF subfamily)